MPNLLIEIGHPSDVLFFKNAINLLKEQDWNIYLYAREKPGIADLLEHEGFDYIKSKDAGSRFGIAKRYIPRVLELYHLSKRLDIDVLTGAHPVHAAPSSRMSGKPCVGFADTDHAFEQLMLYVPNCSKLVTPRFFRYSLGHSHETYRGFHALAYLHPSYFTPEKGLLEEYGVLDQGPPIVMRVIGWQSTHDFGIRESEWRTEFIKEFSKTHRILVSSESQTPKYLRRFQNPIPFFLFHHLLAEAALYVGPGGSSASEACMLGTPAIYTNPLTAGVLNALELRYKMLFQELSMEGILMKTREILETPLSEFHLRSTRILSESEDVTKIIAEAIESQIRDTR